MARRGSQGFPAGTISRHGRPPGAAARGRRPVPDRVRQRNAGVGVSACRRNHLPRGQQARPEHHPSGGLHEQSKGQSELKSIPVLLTTNFPVLKTTRQKTKMSKFVF